MKKFLLIFLVIFIQYTFGQDTKLNVRINFDTGIKTKDLDNLNLEINIYLEDLQISNANITNYPATLIQPVSNPENKDIFFEIDVIGPVGWVTMKNPVKYNKYNPKITLKRVNDAYAIKKKTAIDQEDANSWSKAIESYDYMLLNRMYGTDLHKFEILRGKARNQMHLRLYHAALNSYASILKNVKLDNIKNYWKKVYLDEFYNCILKVGNYNHIKLSQEEIEDLISDQGIVELDHWKSLINLFISVNPNIINSKDLESFSLDNLIKQYNAVSNKLALNEN
ncbi:MAG: hypothetical protein ABJM36_04730 [Algibacter sp.]|uniref:hypothetical protein n=1 Tax=Algibacter sp. TaxID=1872428 RepID=UPI003296F6FF